MKVFDGLSQCRPSTNDVFSHWNPSVTRLQVVLHCKPFCVAGQQRVSLQAFRNGFWRSFASTVFWRCRFHGHLIATGLTVCSQRVWRSPRCNRFEGIYIFLFVFTGLTIFPVLTTFTRLTIFTVWRSLQVYRFNNRYRFDDFYKFDDLDLFDDLTGWTVFTGLHGWTVFTGLQGWCSYRITGLQIAGNQQRVWGPVCLQERVTIFSHNIGFLALQALRDGFLRLCCFLFWYYTLQPVHGRERAATVNLQAATYYEVQRAGCKTVVQRGSNHVAHPSCNPHKVGYR